MPRAFECIEYDDKENVENVVEGYIEIENNKLVDFDGCYDLDPLIYEYFDQEKINYK